MSAYLVALIFAAGPTDVTVQYAPAGPEGTAGRFEVRGLSAAVLADPAGCAAALTVRVDAAAGLLGTAGVSDGVVWFRPRFPVAPGVRHTVTFDPARLPGGGRPATAEETLPRPATPPVTVTAVYPSGDAVPENVLKFYLHFSAPVRRGEAYRRVRILGPTGTPIDLPFLELDEELWDPAGTRLTLLIDPGRIKRGLAPREDVGPVFEAGNRYTLTVDPAWPDAAGNPLKAGLRKAFAVAAPAADRIDVAAWTLTPPGTLNSALEVRFPRPLDHALLERTLTVVDAAGWAVPGRVEVSDAETRWRFTPAKPWAAGTYRLRVAVELEDLAGNRPDRVFDAEGAAAGPPVLERAFRIAAK